MVRTWNRARRIAGDLIRNVLRRRTDRAGIGSTLHMALCEMPMADLGPEAGEAEQQRQHKCRYDTNSTRT